MKKVLGRKMKVKLESSNRKVQRISANLTKSQVIILANDCLIISKKKKMEISIVYLEKQEMIQT